MRNTRINFIVALLVTFAALSLPRIAGGQNDPAPSSETRPAAVSPTQKILFPGEPYDGSDRYRMDKDDGGNLRSIQGLVALSRRWGPKPYGKLWEDDHWQEERVIFHDVSTGAEIWRLTRDAGSDRVPYHKGSWTANGARIVWRRSPGMWESSTKTHGPTVMNADGTHLRPVFRDHRMVRKIQCSKTDPNLCYAMALDRKLVAFNLETGKTEKVLGEFPGCWHLKISNDGKYLCGYYRPDGKREEGRVWVVSADGSVQHEVKVGYIHDSYHFHPRLPLVVYWHERQMRKEGFWQQSFDGAKKINVKMSFDWNHGDFGDDGGIHTTGARYRLDGENWIREKKSLFWPDDTFRDSGPYYDDPANCGGYATWMPKDEPWFLGTRTAAKPWVSELFMCTTEPTGTGRANRFRVCYTNMSRARTMDAPDGSPDGTKVLFNADLFDIPQVYCVVVRRPEPPTGLVAQWQDNSVRLSWKKSKHSKETAGFNVYRSKQSGVGYEQLNTEPIVETSFVDEAPVPNAPQFYAVTAVEHSTLESGFSAEAVALKETAVAERPRRIFVEAERGRRDDRLWVGFEGGASDLFYIWNRAKVETGTVSVPVAVPRSGDYHLWARVRSPVAGALGAAGGSAPIGGPAWHWVRCGKAPLREGHAELELSLSAYGTALDCLFLAQDKEFLPTGRNNIESVPPARVEDLQASTDGPFAARLRWEASVAKDLHHYNLYVCPARDFIPSRGTLIASPAANDYYDWQVDLKTKSYYRVTAVDRRGNESVPSEACELVPEPIEVVTIEKEFQPKLTFEVPKDGTYACWLKLKKTKVSGAGFYLYLTMDGAGKRTWTVRYPNIHDLGPDEAWFTYGQFGRFNLDAGQHVLTVDAKYTVTRVLLTNDLSFLPEGYPLTGFGW